jgi:hypothetical protein
LWEEALTIFGDRAHELSFLRSRATSPGYPFDGGSEQPDGDERPDIDHDRSHRSARPAVSARHQASRLPISGGRTTEEKRGVEL